MEILLDIVKESTNLLPSQVYLRRVNVLIKRYEVLAGWMIAMRNSRRRL